mgnify:CR=1 FL=1
MKENQLLLRNNFLVSVQSGVGVHIGEYIIIYKLSTIGGSNITAYTRMDKTSGTHDIFDFLFKTSNFPFILPQKPWI